MFVCPKCGGPYCGADIKDGEIVAYRCHCRVDGSHDGLWDDHNQLRPPGSPHIPRCGWVGPAYTVAPEILE